LKGVKGTGFGGGEELKPNTYVEVATEGSREGE